ncbi:MAG: amidase [Kiloniellales bacterium]
MDDPLGAFLPGPRVRLEGAPDGPLRGLTFAAKDIFDVAGQVTGCGNPDWARTHGPAIANAPAVQAWLDAGASLAGKTITDELAYSLNGQNVHYGTPANSNAPGRIPGGSSCGSAAAVAGGAVDLALGSDTGGSIRVPASYCGLFGLRPTHGRIPLAGVMPLASSFDTFGWFARDAALLRRAGAVLLDDVADEQATPSGLLLAEDAFELAETGARSALAPLVDRLEAQLGRAERVTLGEPGGGLEQWMLRFRHLQAREIWAQHGAWIEREKPRFGPEIQERFDWARSVPQSAVAEAAPQREAFTERMESLLRGGRVLCLPSTPGIAPLLNAGTAELQQHRSRVLSLTSIAGLARLPQVTLPLAQMEGCPLGLSLIAARGGDALLLAFAERFAETAVARNETWGV